MKYLSLLKHAMETSSKTGDIQKAEVIGKNEFADMALSFNNLMGVLKNHRDNLDTLVKNKTAELQESEERFRALYENAPVGYQSLDENGDFIGLNDTWCSMLGYEKEEVLGKNFSEFVHPDFQDVFKENFPKLKRLGAILGVEFELLKKDGSEIVVSLDGKVKQDQDGTFIQTNCVFQDITQRKKIEEVNTMSSVSISCCPT